MDEVGIRALKQNASAVVRGVSRGAAVVVTDRGRPVAQLVPLPTSGMAALLVAGLLRAPRIDRLPDLLDGSALTVDLAEARSEERF